MTIVSVSCGLVTISNLFKADWVLLDSGPVPLRCWWATPDPHSHDFVSKSHQNRVVIVLPEVFGVNAWVRSVAERISSQGIPALAMPLFARTAPGLNLGYSDADLVEGRRHKDATTAEQILADVGTAIHWLQAQKLGVQISVVGFCFGGHAAVLAATLPAVRSTFNFYGAGVSRMRPGGGPPTLELLSTVPGRLTCFCGTADPLIPAEDRAAIQAALHLEDPSAQRFRYLEMEGADHGFMCEARSSYNLEAAEHGWQVLLNTM